MSKPVKLKAKDFPEVEGVVFATGEFAKQSPQEQWQRNRQKKLARLKQKENDAKAKQAKE